MIRTMEDLATTYHAQDCHAEDEEISTKVLGLRQQTLGGDTPRYGREYGDPRSYLPRTNEPRRFK